MRILMAGTGSTGRSGHGEKNFEQTVRHPVDLEPYRAWLTFTQRQLLDARHGRYARVWGMAAHRHITDELKPGDQVWFHHDGYVNDVSQVVTVIHRNLGFDEALWGVEGASGFVFTVTEPQPARISKASINELLGYKEKNHFVANRLLTDEQSELLADAFRLTMPSA
jgi:hypothetical protein